MGRFIHKYQLILFLSFVGGGLFTVKYFYKPNLVVNEVERVIIPTPTQVVVKDKTETNYEIIADQLMPLWRLLPYQGSGFVVENYLEEGILIVTLKGNTKEKALIEIENWMKLNNIDPKSHQIEWR